MNFLCKNIIIGNLNIKKIFFDLILCFFFLINFILSKIACKIPKNIFLLGFIRYCFFDKILRSKRVKYLTFNIKIIKLKKINNKNNNI
jgi:hypothetical protein